MSGPASAPKVKRVVAGILVREREVLCCQRPASDPFPLKWEFPGGKIESGETPEQALVRELEEELAIRAKLGPLVETVHHSYTPGVQVKLHFFRVSEWSGEIQNLIFNDVRWVEHSEIPKLDFLEADKEIVRRIAAGQLL